MGKRICLLVKNEHRHSRIKFVTTNQRHDGLDVEIQAKREVLYQTKRNEHPQRWSKEEETGSQ